MFKSHPGVARSRTNETLQSKSDGPFLQENGYSAATLDIREFEGGEEQVLRGSAYSKGSSSRPCRRLLRKHSRRRDWRRGPCSSNKLRFSCLSLFLLGECMRAFAPAGATWLSHGTKVG